ncbi:WEB family protein At2g38370-like isoform X2 [Vicia villosa]|uniref:WEB family protein At2g38370-like isoform X2 n=1 Tax=Vicia villosa TaxID=3911 RepID=UPI00273BDEFA|nr:WEB family protein At2g38370-like isoform X2 [Vicia villosa]
METPDNVVMNRIEPGSKENGLRAEIDTSAPFESVKEAVSRFGGVGYWKPTNNVNLIAPQQDTSELDAEKLEEQTVGLEKELILKERETLDVLKELESTKKLVENLKSKLHAEESETNLNIKMNLCDKKENEKEEEKENQVSRVSYNSTSPGLILKELKQAKLNLNRSTNDIADVRVSVESLNKKLEKERISLEKTCARLTQNSSKITYLEEELNQTRLKLQVVKEAEIECGSDEPSDVTKELQRLSSEAERFKKMGEAAKSEVMRAMSEIEQTKAMIRTSEIRLVAARKMKEAAKAAEAAAMAEIKVLSYHDGDCMLKRNGVDGVTLTFEEYNALTCKARDAEEQSKKRVLDAMAQVDEANLSKMDVLKRVEEATLEVKTSKVALEEALERVEAATRGKLVVEEALRNWRSEGQKRRSSIHNNMKFKNPSHIHRHTRLFDVYAMNQVDDEAKEPVLKPTLSIGQILSRKLMKPGEFEGGMIREKGSMKRKVSLGQMLGKQNYDPSCFEYDKQVEKENGQKQFSAKRKKFGFGRFSLHLTKQQKKKKPTLNLR